ncbi:MAG: BatD family protein, partial [Bacteroidales bacterium]|nr:BatD family protein [Bacteroidales bacterium]
MRQINTLLVILFLPISVTMAQEITVRVDCPRVVMLGEQIRVAYTVNTSGGEFMSPSFDGFYLLSGPNTSYSKSTQIVNGRSTSETAYSYVFYIQAIQEGKFTVPAGKYTKGGKTYSSESLEIEVLK